VYKYINTQQEKKGSKIAAFFADFVKKHNHSKFIVGKVKWY